jgi:regulator of protease activity HflC (stomatin/prohibitin superfamily)
MALPPKPTNPPQAGKGTNMVPTKFKLIAGLVLGLILLLAVNSVSKQLLATNNAGYYQIKQAAVSGELSVHSEPGTYLRLFGNITTYHVSDMYYFSKNDLDGGSGKESDPINVRFNDGGTAEVSGGIKFRLPTDPVKQQLLHRDFKTFENVKHDLIRQTVAEALMQTATLMRAEESYSSRRSEFTSLVEDQVRKGIFETVAKESKIKDADGNEFIEKNVTVKLDEKGQPVIRKISPFNQYGIEIVSFVIKDLDFDKTIDALIAKKKEAEQMKVVAQANAERAKQDAITAREQGAANIAKEKAEQDVEKIKQVTIAEREFEVSQLRKKQADQDALATIATATALAEGNRLKVIAGLTPLERATIQKETAIGVAEQLANVQFPAMMNFGGGANSPTDPFQAIGLESFMRLSDKLAGSQDARTEKRNTRIKALNSRGASAPAAATTSDSGNSGSSDDSNNNN